MCSGLLAGHTFYHLIMQAVERMRVTVQLRRRATAPHGIPLLMPGFGSVATAAAMLPNETEARP
jgi:hypothetical protein